MTAVVAREKRREEKRRGAMWEISGSYVCMTDAHCRGLPGISHVEHVYYTKEMQEVRSVLSVLYTKKTFQL